jgi:hypothetical protein
MVVRDSIQTKVIQFHLFVSNILKLRTDFEALGEYLQIYMNKNAAIALIIAYTNIDMMYTFYL